MHLCRRMAGVRFIFVAIINFVSHLIASTMSKVFRVTPKRTKRVNGQVITPEMVITVTTRQHCLNPFYNGAVEVQEQYMRMYQFDYKKACMSVADFTYQALD